MGASESKLAFKEDIFRLAGESDIPADSSWWTRFYQLPESADDVFALWSPNDLRSLTLSTPDIGSRNALPAPKKNAETLIYAAISRLEALQTRHCYSDIHMSIAPEVLNCVRILTRLLPYVYEADHLNVWEDKFFWQPHKPTSTWDHQQNRQGPLFDGLNPKKKFSEGDEDKEIGRPLGEQLIDLLINYLFFPNFTLPKKLDANGKPDLNVNFAIWQSGIGCKQSNGMTRENERNAMEVLRLLLTLTSRTMYISPNVVATTDIKPLTYLTTQSTRQVVLSVVCSLLNTVLKYNPASWRVPIDLTAAKDPKQLLVTYCLHFLLVLVIYPVPHDEPNAFRKALSRLHRAEDFQFIQQGLTLVLTQPVSGVTSYFPGGQKVIPWAPEMLVLFWELLQCNKRFRSFIIDTDRAHDFLVLVLYYAMEAKDDPARQGIVRMCVFILQTLSVEPSFGKRLNKPFVGQESLPAILKIQNFHGSYADYLITSIHTMLTTTKGRLESIYPALLAIVVNIAPFVRDLQRATSSRLLDLFVTMSSPKFLLANETNHTLLLSLLEALNAILDHQYEGNRRFVEVLVRCHKRFEALRDFTVEGAMEEVDRQAQERKDRTGSVMGDAGVRSPSRATSMDSMRSPVSNRTAHLGNVPEESAFAIGEDDEDDEEHGGMSVSRTSMSSAVEDAVPTQSRSMSEKARGKLPMGQGSFSRSTSRNASTTSLASITPQTNSAFMPTQDWLSLWLPYLPLHNILQAIEQYRPRRDERASHSSARGASSQRTSLSSPPPIGLAASRDGAANPSATTTNPESAGDTNSAGGGGRSAAEVVAGADRGEPAEIRVQSFSWSPLAIGWYLSMLWSFAYAQDMATNKGSSGIWTNTAIKLFNVRESRHDITLRSPKGAVDAVGASLVQRLGNMSLGGGGGAAGAAPGGQQQSTREV